MGLALLVYGVSQGPVPSAATLTLSDTPLFLGLNVPPNIVLSMDDSGSMDFEVLTKDFARDGTLTGTQRDGTSPSGSGSLKNRDNEQNGSVDCSPSYGIAGYIYSVTFSTNAFSGGTYNCETADNKEWRFRNYQFNALYFNPNRTYTPWSGVDAAGNPFADMDIHNAKDNPYSPTSLKIDLTTQDSRGPSSPTTTEGFRYYTWTDTNGNGRFDDGEETAFLIKDQNAATQQNFANWFSYYRKREYVFKKIYGDLIANATIKRMGFVTLHDNVNGIKSAITHANTPVKDMNADPTTGNKRALLDALYSADSRGGTPLRVTLYNIGQYLECASGRALFTTDCPALTVSGGGACQQNFVVFATDGFDNVSFSSLPSSNANADGNKNTTFDGGAYADSYSNTLADIAMHFYERDLQPSLSNNVPITPGIDEATHQHMVTYTISFGLDGTIASMPTDPKASFSWPDPSASASGKIDDLRHAAYNGRGLFLSAADPGALQDAIEAAFQDIADRTSSAASVALNSGSRNANSRVYQARFNSGDWSGQLLSFPLNTDGTVGTPEWDTGTMLDTQNYDTGRVILTTKPSTKAGIAFRWSNLDTAQQTALNTNTSGVNDGLGSARLNYLRGSRVDEGKGNKFRVRLHLLGDLVNSDPFFVGAPPFSDSLGNDYATFRSTYANRKSLVVVGSNDGYVHVVDATTGKEILAYLPSMLMSKMVALTYAPYIHKYYVDGSPTVGDAYGDFSHTGSSKWRTVAVGGLRAGGQGYYALDITDPTSFTESNASKLVLWEFSDADDKDLGYSFSQPSIVRMANGRWAAIFGNGYNNSVSDGTATTSTTGTASLFIVFLDGRASGTWVKGTDYIKIDTKVGSTGTPNGLAAPTPIDTNNDNTINYIVAGDLQGNVWSFDVTSTDPAQWKSLYVDGSGNPQPLYTAKDAAGNAQPITARMEVGEHPLGKGGYVVYFGTGQYMAVGDSALSNAKTQSVYGIWDKVDGIVPSLSRSSLVQQTVVSELAVNDETVRVLSNNTVDWSLTTTRGFYLDLPTTGERQVSDPLLRGGRLIFTTLIPDSNICSFGGTSFLMELSASTGGLLPEPAFDIGGGANGTPDGIVDQQDKVTIPGTTDPKPPGGRKSKQGILPSPTVLSAGSVELKYNSGSSGGIFVTTESPSRASHGRQAWRQLF
jgi:type IV pilus assembly protein PilY1